MPELSRRGIFLSYRRAETGPSVRSLQSRLEERFPDVPVFLDFDSIEPGLKFATEIQEAVNSCVVLVAIIGPGWATTADEEGHRRLDKADDWVRCEIQAALQRGTRVIPVLVDGAGPAELKQLPAGLEELAELQVLELSHARHKYDMDRFLDVIKRVISASTHRPLVGGFMNSYHKILLRRLDEWLNPDDSVAVFAAKLKGPLGSTKNALIAVRRSDVAIITDGDSSPLTAPYEDVTFSDCRKSSLFWFWRDMDLPVTTAKQTHDFSILEMNQDHCEKLCELLRGQGRTTL